jgi:hypothetical protein
VSSTPVPAAAEAQPAPVPPKSAWDISSSIRGSLGWRENVTVSSVAPINRSFWRAEAETFVLRPVGDRWQFVGFVSGDVLRYFDAPQFGTADNRIRVSGEEQWVADFMARWQPFNALRTTLKGVGLLQETFIDPSQSEGEPLPATLVRFGGAYVSLAPRVTLPWGFSVEPSLQEKKIDYRRGYDGDFTESRPGALVEWKRSDLLVLTASWYDHLRHYAHLTPASGGHVIRNRLLTLRQREAELKATSTFTAGGKWTIGLAGGELRNRDRANGFLDYNQKRAQLDVGWEHSGWRLTASGEAKHLEYINQKVGFDVLTPRIADVYDVTGRIERDLTGKWMLFAEHRWERSRSNINDPAFSFSYRTTTSLVGVQRSF